MYKIHDKLSGAEEILHALGYHPREPSVTDSFASSPTQELVYREEVSRDHVANVATDLVLLQSDLQLLREKIRTCRSHSSRGRWLAGVLRAWENNVRDVSVWSAGTVGESRSFGSEGGVCCDGGGGPAKYVPSFQHRTDETEDSGYTSDGVPLHSKNSKEFSKKDMQTKKKGGQNAGESRNGQVLEDNSFERIPANPQQHLSHLQFSPADRSKGFYQRDSYRTDELLSNSASAEEDSFLSGAQFVPRPNIDDLPEPVYGMDDGDDIYSPVRDDDDCQNSLGHIVDSRSDFRDDSLIGQQYYASLPPDESIVPSLPSSRPNGFSTECSEEGLLHPVREVGAGDSFKTLEQNSDKEQHQSQLPPECSSSDLTDAIIKSYVFIDNVPPAPSNSMSSSAKTSTKESHDDRSEVICELKPNGAGESCSDSTNTNKMMTCQLSSLCERSKTVDGFTVVDIQEGGECVDNSHKILDTPISQQTTQATGSLSEYWTCNYCTYINTKDILVCDICGVDRHKLNPT